VVSHLTNWASLMELAAFAGAWGLAMLTGLMFSKAL
jgi:hypothetical protein